MLEWLRWLFDTEGFPPRWRCGSGWTNELGWTHIVSDIAIWASYTAIPIILAIFVLQRKDAPFPKVFWLFVAFIFLCGTVHLIEAIIFWQPVYHLSSVVKVSTAVVSVATVCVLIPIMPRALSLRSPDQLEREVKLRTKSLQESEEHQRLLMSELDHRVKNNITAIISLADQTIASTGDFDAFRKAFVGRLTALARTHESLSASNWSGAHLHNMVEQILEPYGSQTTDRLHVEGPPVRLDSKSSLSVGMAIHELATNSVKYGSLSVQDGRVSLTWRLDENGVHIQWVERDGPPVEPPEQSSFGMSLMHGVIEHELQGEIEMNFGKLGVECNMRIPSDCVVHVIPDRSSTPNPHARRQS